MRPGFSFFNVALLTSSLGFQLFPRWLALGPRVAVYPLCNAWTWSLGQSASLTQQFRKWLIGEGGGASQACCKGMSCDSKWWLWKEPLGLPCWVAWLITWKTALPEAYQGQLEPFGTGKVFSEMGWWFPTVVHFVLVSAACKTMGGGWQSVPLFALVKPYLLCLPPTPWLLTRFMSWNMTWDKSLTTSLQLPQEQNIPQHKWGHI